MLLADQGADVIKVDPPGGPRWDTPANATWNRGKRSIVLDLKNPVDLQRARTLVKSADVLVENFRPGVMERIGMGTKVLTDANPRLVYCSMPGFASDDPRARVPAWEGIIAAAATSLRGPLFGDGSTRPAYSAIPIASSYAAFQAVVSIGMALWVREHGDTGQCIEVPLFDSMFTAIGGQHILNPPPPKPGLGGTWNGQFECKDGRWVMFGSGNNNFREFVKAAGITSWDKKGLTDRERLFNDPELAAEQERKIIALFKTRTAQAWEDLIARAGSEGAVCRTSAEWLEHPHAIESKAVIEVNDPKLGKTLQPGINPRLAGTPGFVRGPAPTLDQHREEILAEIEAGPRPTSNDEVRASLRSALKGVKVLDLCIILAGPTCGRTLAEFGANVIKIDNPNRDTTIASHNSVNRGKRSILLDLKSDEGKEIFWRLLEDTDVVVQNYRKGRIDSLGLSYEEVRKRKPDIIYASLNAYGHIGPWADRPGHEQFAQATTGMQARFGGSRKPQLQPHPINDFGTGLMGAYGVALALLHRQKTGEGQFLDCALAYTAMTLQSSLVQGYEGKIWDEPSGQDALGSGPLHRAFQASDGWVFFGARIADLPALSQVPGLEGVEKLRGKELERMLEERFRHTTVEQWVGKLTRVGIGSHRIVTSSRELMEDGWVRAHGLSITRDHEGWGPITTTGPAPRLSRTPVQPGRVAPRPGSDAKVILSEIGMANQLDRLVNAGVIRTEGVTASER
jgi:crotonobetainyl-CoA:carnitine CoA-transferase CaiB-like acyl-CoA transferase